MTDSDEEVNSCPSEQSGRTRHQTSRLGSPRTSTSWEMSLAVRLELVQQEMPVGPFSLDISGERRRHWHDGRYREPVGRDRPHPSRTTAYLCLPDAAWALQIWVAPEFGYEHAQALDRLNKWTGDAIRFYGVKIEVIKNAADSSLEHKFHKVVYPGGWNKKLTLRSGRCLRSPGATTTYSNR